jgi:hypothetical protein
MKIGTGYSRVLPSREAGGRAAVQALKGSGPRPAVTFVFTTEGYDQEQVLDSVRSEVGDSRVIGASGAGIVTSEGIFADGVNVMVIAGPGIEAVTAIEDFRPEAPGETGKRLGHKLLAANAATGGTVFVFPDGLAGNIALMLRGLYEVMGPDFKYAGGGTGDNLRFLKTYQFTESGVASGAVAAALLTGVTVGTGVGHGWEPVGSPLVITRAEDKFIHEFDERPAFSVYSERLGGIEPARFPEYGLRHPLGIVDAAGRFVIRDPLRVLSGGTLELVTEVPPRAVAYLMEGRMEKLAEAAREVFRAALSAAGEPGFALFFDCVSRVLLTRGAVDDVRIGREAFGPAVPVAGMLTFGEVGAYADVPLFHNKALVAAIGGQPR